ncbi:MAG: structure-specific recognition protein-domain-containing protein, partial [Olpidium bornovanus]
MLQPLLVSHLCPRTTTPCGKAGTKGVQLTRIQLGKNRIDGYVGDRESFYSLRVYSAEVYAVMLSSWHASLILLSLIVDKKPAFEIPLEEIANTSLAAKNEVSIEFLTAEEAAAYVAPGSRKRAGKKVPDQLVEMRFYIPGTVTERTKKAKLEEAQDVKEEEDESESEVQNAAAAFHELLKARAEVGNVSGGGIVLFQEILCLTPRW